MGSKIKKCDFCDRTFENHYSYCPYCGISLSKCSTENNKLVSWDNRLISFAFSVLVTAAVGGLLQDLSTSIDLKDNDLWVFASLIIILSTISLIVYIFEKYPDNWIPFLKTLMIGLASMTTFSLIRFYHFFSNPENLTGSMLGLLNVSYNIFLGSLIFIGVLLFTHSIVEKETKKKKGLGIAATIVLIIGISLYFFPIS